MNKRSEVLQLFGPKLIEALALDILNELNILRAKHGLPPRTKLQVYDALMNQANHLPDYDWMSEIP